MSDKEDASDQDGAPRATPTFDDILCAIGELGPWQKLLCCLVPLVGVMDGLNALAQVFFAGEADHWCRVASWEEANCTSTPSPDDWECLVEKRNASIPFNATTEAFDSCHMYDVRGVEFAVGFNASGSANLTIECPDGWVYDTSQYKTTITNEFDLVCDKKGAVSFLQSIFFAGFLVGSVVFGSLADLLGRKPTIYIASALLLLASIGNVFSPNVIVYMVMRFCIGAGVMGAFLAAYVLVTEYIGPSKRALVGVALQAFFAFGLTVLPLLAYSIRTWRLLQLVIALPTVLYFLLFFYMPESARWQMSKGRYKQAEKTLRKVAATNKKEFPEEMFSPDVIGAAKEESGGQQTVVGLFRTPNMCIKTLNLMFNWFVNNMVYYGLGLSTSDFGVDDYVAAAIAGFVEFPSIVYCVIALQYSGRRVNLSGTMVVGGIACVICAFLEMGVARTIIAMVGKFCISASFAIIYVVSGEIFPTPVRSAGMGLSSMAARISGIISPFMLELKSLWAPLPFVVFGVLSIAAGSLALLLPETKDKKLPETMEEGEAFGKPKCFGGSGINDESVALATDVDSPLGVSDNLFDKREHLTQNDSFWRSFEGLAEIYEDVWGSKITRLR
ncbi:organic cation transporter protein-like [Patiria miniata]|uniref:Major facilitator superfamily (MFS) profile domain-containing protein n=1 Tax=Patiria miniata TaxID=46514 RepID=A0A914A4K0_PATMI|nr:organic cation transporter protein-like [Patiria miniata]